jgi:NAD(P)-dependent dehydrogenase (short-subunit alcohol dehydrogenase family)
MSKQLRPVNGKVVAITGGARGIGRATAAAFLANGARVAIGDLDPELTRQVADELGAGAVGLPLDVTSRASFGGFLDEVERRLGPLDVLVNNAGIQSAGDFAHERDAVTEHTFDVNLGGCALGCKLGLARLLERDSGHIVNVASALGRTAVPGGVTYCASKYAVVGLSEALRAELEGTAVELHLILPGVVDTEMSSGLRALRGIRTVEPADVGTAIVDAVRSGRREVYVPRSVGMLVRLQPITPRPLAALIRRLLRSDRLLTRFDPLERAAYEARIAPPAEAAALDPAATVASAAASVADAVRAGNARLHS